MGYVYNFELDDEACDRDLFILLILQVNNNR